MSNKKEIMNKKTFILLALICASVSTQAQLGKLKGLMGKKDTAQSSADTTKKQKAGGSGGGLSGLMGKAMTKLATAAGGMAMKASGMLSTTADLSETVPLVTMTSNLYPAELGTATQTFLKGWQSNGDMVTLMFTKKDGFGFYKIDGSVTINGQPATYATVGTYSAFSPNNSAPKKVEITTTSGQKSSFTLLPYDKPFKILTINGQKDAASIDLSKDVVVEFDKAPISENGLLKLSIAINQIGIKSFYDLPYIKSAKTITIPAASFRNINIVPGGKALYNYKNSYLSIAVEKVAMASAASGTLPAMKYDVAYLDGKLLNVVKEPVLNLGINAKGSDKFPAGEVDYNFFKANAFLGRPFSQIKTLGVMSFAIRGTTYTEGKESTTSSSYTVGNTKYTTVTTSKTIAKFPQLANEVWDKALESLYKDFVDAAQKELNAPVLPLASITKTEGYQAIAPFSKDDENTSVEFSRAYKDTKLLSAFMPVSEGYGPNNANGRIMKQSGANALMKFTFDLQLAIEDGKPVMVPKLAFEIVGEPNANLETKFCTATITGKGVRYPKGEITAAELDNVVRKSDLLATFKKGLQELKASEKANGDYDLVWNLQK